MGICRGWIVENKETLLKIGSVVKLKSEDTPSMVINKELSDEMVECVWFNGNISKKEIFNINNSIFINLC
ncbi:MAG: hypothetical protein DRG78_01650 [Epsilonproteobacteria bacterium]|nr:MAG: hypothetical protein DRG78_01650 [Campylobacterota bacterium]